MSLLLRKVILSLSLSGAVFVLPVVQSAASQDEKTGVTKKPDDKGAKPNDEKKGEGTPKDKDQLPPDKLPDFAKDYASAGEVSGVVVVTANEKSITVRFSTVAPSGKKKVKEITNDVTFKYAEGGLARTKVHPTSANEKGKMVKIPTNELEPLKKPQGAPGWHVARGDVKSGAIVTLTLLRPKSIPASKVTQEDKLIKFAVITGETTAPNLTPEEAAKLKDKSK